MLIKWMKENDERYTAERPGLSLVLQNIKRAWQLIVTRQSDGHVMLPPNRWASPTVAQEAIEAAAMKVEMRKAPPAVQRVMPPLVIKKATLTTKVERIHATSVARQGKVAQTDSDKGFDGKPLVGATPPKKNKVPWSAETDHAYPNPAAPKKRSHRGAGLGKVVRKVSQ